MKLRVSKLAIACGLAACGLAGCGNLDDFTEVKDLRVLAVKADPAGILINLDDPGAALDADLQARITALVVDPTTDGGPVFFTALGCPDFLDAITAASGQTTRVCAPPGAPTGVPDPLGMVLSSREIATAGMMAPVAPGSIQYEPVIPEPGVPAYGLTHDQVGLFFSPQPFGVPALDQAIAYNRDFGIDAIVDMTFTLGAQKASAVKRIPYWPQLEPGQVPNQNPVIERVDLFRKRDEMTGELLEPIDQPATVSLADGDKLYVLPVIAPGSVETYPLRVRNTQTREVETQSFNELLTFTFFTTVGTMFPAERLNTPPIFSPPGSPIRLESELLLSPLAVQRGVVDIWVVVREERAGANWAHLSVTVVP